MKNSTLAIVVSWIAATGATQAVTIVSSYGTTSGANDNNQAGPIRGVTYKIITSGTYTNPNGHTLSASDPTATTVQLSNLKWQTSSSGNGFTASALFVSVFSGLTVDGSGNVTSLGTFIGSSTNSFPNTVGVNTEISYNFNNLSLTNNASYQFVFTSTATPTLTTDVGAAGMELNVVSNGLTETELVGGNATAVTNRAGWEPVFSLTYNSVPEPSAALLGGLGVLGLLRRRRTA